MEPSPIVDADGALVVTDKPVNGPGGQPYLNALDQPIAWELGFRRDHSFYSHNPDSFRHYESAARQAGLVLNGMPGEVKSILWQNLPKGSRLARDPVDLWTDAIFELAWQKIPGVPLRATEKATWKDNHSFQLTGLTDMRRMFPTVIPHDVPDHPEYWYSRLEDMFAASVAAIDVLIGLSDRTRTGSSAIKVLLLSANPVDSRLERLQIDEEFRAIDQKIQSSELRDQVKIMNHGAVRLEDVAALLMRHTPHIVHFSGHGATAGIATTGADGRGRIAPPGALANIFQALNDNVRVVVLNACHSATQAEAIVSVIDCAVGMSDEISDDAAIAFAAGFYEALGYGKSVQDAFDLAQVLLEDAGADRSLAKLYNRPTVNPSDIILVKPPSH